MNLKLSICIATLNRAGYIVDTLRTIDDQIESLKDMIEIVIVDGASTDGTQDVITDYINNKSYYKYFREDTNSGIDVDYDKAVKYASGEYCWLMTDDDHLIPGALNHVIKHLSEGHDLVIVNSLIMDASLNNVIQERFVKENNDRVYGFNEGDQFLADLGSYLSFIGCVIIKRSVWLSRKREPYYGSLFVHAGVIFQTPIVSTYFVSKPLIAIRYGNAMWTPRGYEIWMYMWPELIWGFSGYSDQSKSKVTLRYPWHNFKKLLMYRALGGYSNEVYLQRYASMKPGFMKLKMYLVSLIPGWAVNTILSAYCLIFNRRARSGAYDLAKSDNATFISRFVARKLGVSN
jgi:abequosyltransferase